MAPRSETKQWHIRVRLHHGSIIALFLTTALLPSWRVASPEAHQSFAAEPRVLAASTVGNVRGPEAPKQAPQLVTKDIYALPNISAQSFLVADGATGKIALEQNASEPLPIASLTKLMTALVAYETLDLRGGTVISEDDTSSERPVLGLRISDEVLFPDLLRAMLVGSANDAALALSNAVEAATGQVFTDLMNQKAADLGMTSTHFSNATGFDSRYNYATAEDLLKLISALNEVSFFDGLGRMTSYAFTSGHGTHYRVSATNKLVSKHADITGIKTGFTAQARGAMITKINHDEHAYFIIILSSENREADTLALREVVNSHFIWQ